jgi:hypothetical protein
MAVPEICLQNVSPKENILHHITMRRAAHRASTGTLGNEWAVSLMWLHIRVSARSVGMFVYMDTASAVKR